MTVCSNSAFNQRCGPVLTVCLEVAVIHTNIAQYVSAWAFTNEEHLTFYEAKRAGETLSSHVPQVIAQCLAL